MSTQFGPATEAKIREVVEAARTYGRNSLIALCGVPGTGKSFVALQAAQRLASHPLMVREIQFHAGYSYEQFVEGYRPTASGGFSVAPGLFLEWSDQARQDPDNTYVLLIEELTRANLPAVLGELLTYVEYRDRAFTTLYSKRPVRIAENLVILGTFNPRDRSALELDEAIIRRLRIIPFRPDPLQLEEMLAGRNLSRDVISRLQDIFVCCQERHADDYDALMPFGHGIFADVRAETPDLHLLWVQRIRHLLRRPGHPPHPFAETIEELYPWIDPHFRTNQE